MLYLTKAEAVIVHIPRTGGNWLIEATKLLEIDHDVIGWVEHPRQVYRQPTLDKHMLLAHVDIRWKYAAAFIRGPLDYYEATWRHLTDGRSLRLFLGRSKKTCWHPMAAPFSCWTTWSENPPFDVWLDRMVAAHPGWLGQLFDWYIGPSRRQFCEFVGQTRTIKDDYALLLERLGYGERHELLRQLVPLTRVNSVQNPSRVEWTTEMINKVSKSETAATVRSASTVRFFPRTEKVFEPGTFRSHI